MLQIVLRQKGYTINHKTVLKLMKEQSQGKQKNSKIVYKGESAKIDDSLREFALQNLFEKLADILNLKLMIKKYICHLYLYKRNESSGTIEKCDGLFTSKLIFNFV